MNRSVPGLLAVALAMLCSCILMEGSKTSESCKESPAAESMDSALAASLQSLLDKYVRQGLPGASLAVRGPFGNWEGAAGYASLEGGTRLQPCHLHFLASATKPILAAAVLKEAEKGNLDPDEPVCGYLPHDQCGRLYESERQTWGKLLGHRSRIPDYASSWRYRSDWLMNPLRPYGSRDLLEYVGNEKAGEELRQGNGYYYSNTNYLLLALALDARGREGHAALLKESVFGPMGMDRTVYAREALESSPGLLVNSYFDRFGNGHLENISDIERHDESRAIGSNGLVSTAGDMALFMESLFQGRLLDSAGLHAMTNGAFFDPAPDSLEGKGLYYGLGMGYSYSRENGLVLEHDGANPGAQSLIRYGREGRVTMALLCNLGLYSKNPFQSLGDEVMEVLRGAEATRP